MFSDLFADSHLLNAQKPVTIYYIIKRFVGMIVQRSVYYALLDVDQWLCAVWNRTDNFCSSIRKKVATWVTEHSVQNISVEDFKSKCS